jgi:hypothetical protein
MVDKDWMVYAMGLLHDQNTIAVCFGYQKNLSFFLPCESFFPPWVLGDDAQTSPVKACNWGRARIVSLLWFFDGPAFVR